MSDEIIYSNIQAKVSGLYVCGGDGTCVEQNVDLCTLTPLNTCSRYSTNNSVGDICPADDIIPMVGVDDDHTWVIICCGSNSGITYGFSASFLSENSRTEDGTGYGDCIALIADYEGTDGDYCDRAGLNYTFPPSCP